MRFTRSLFLSLTVALALTVGACAPQGSEPPASTGSGALSVALHASAATADRTTPVTFTFTLANSGQEPRRVLRLLTPLDGIDADILVVERDGQAVPYVGKRIKLAEPEADDYVELQPGASVSAAFDPAEAYDMSAPGTYTVRYRAPALHVTQPTGYQLQLRRIDSDVAGVESAPVTVSLKGVGETPEERLASNGKGGGGGGGTRQTCTTDQLAILATAKANATVISGNAQGYLATNTTDVAGFYATWFDASGARQYWSTVDTHYVTIHDAFATQTVTFDCSCKQKNVYAYVYPDKPYTIYLCGYYWKAPAVGFDSQAGTLVHEMSHFNVTASTQDWVYGQSNAMNLAETNVSEATTNADNHEYFAESQSWL